MERDVPSGFGYGLFFFEGDNINCFRLSGMKPSLLTPCLACFCSYFLYVNTEHIDGVINNYALILTAKEYVRTQLNTQGSRQWY